MPIKHAELFAGIGGFGLAARWMGWKNVLQVENDSWCQEQLKRNFKGTKLYGDIKEFNGTKYKGQIDVLSGGFPCQPFSLSGNRQGESDDRYLWPEMRRVCKEIRPRFIVAENVPGLINMGLDKVLDDLEAENYTCWPPIIVPACAAGADHLRERVWIIAHTSSLRLKIPFNECKVVGRKKGGKKRTTQHNSPPIVAEQFEKSYGEPLLLTSKNGLSTELDYIKMLHATGNAIVPQVAFEFFKHIENFL